MGLPARCGRDCRALTAADDRCRHRPAQELGACSKCSLCVHSRLRTIGLHPGSERIDLDVRPIGPCVSGDHDCACPRPRLSRRHIARRSDRQGRLCSEKGRSSHLLICWSTRLCPLLAPALSVSHVSALALLPSAIMDLSPNVVSIDGLSSHGTPSALALLTRTVTDVELVKLLSQFGAKRLRKLR